MARKAKPARRAWLQPLSRVVWWAILFFSLYLYVNDLVVTFTRLELAFPSVIVNEFDPAAVSSALAVMGWSKSLFLLLYLLPEIVATLGFFIVGIMIGLRPTGNWFSWFVSVWMILFGVAAPSTFAFSGADSQMFFLYYLPILFSYVGIVYFLLAFPDGKFNPRWTLYLALAWSFFTISTIIVPWFNWESAASALVIVLILAAVLYSYIYRYRRVFTPAQKEQTKWLIAAIVLNIITVALSGIFANLAVAASGQPDSVTYILLANTAEFLGNLLLVLAVGISILRYRLWDIEVVVNRALIYGPLSLILAGVFAVSVVLVNQSTRQLFGAEDPNTSAIISALIAATIFTPLRTRIENWINRKVYSDSANLAREFIEISDPRFALSVSELAQLVAMRIGRVLNSEATAVYLPAGKTAFKRSATIGRNLPQNLRLDAKARTALTAGKVTSEGPAHLLVPLYVPRLRTKELQGVLALGFRKNGHEYSSDDRSALANLGGQVGVALHAAHLRSKRR